MIFVSNRAYLSAEFFAVISDTLQNYYVRPTERRLLGWGMRWVGVRQTDLGVEESATVKVVPISIFNLAPAPVPRAC
jgi:hypothetical protein